MSIRENSTAKHAKVKQALREKISRGDYGANGLLPSDRELMRRLKVSRQTVMRAVHDLRAEGVLRREHGKGTFVNTETSQAQIGILTYLDRNGTPESAYSQNLLRSV